MMPKDGDVENLNLTDPTFTAFFLKAFGNDGFLPYKIKCIVLFMTLWILGFAHASVKNVLDLFIQDVSHHMIIISSAISLILTFHICRGMNRPLRELNKIFKPPETEFKKFVREWNGQSPFLYYFNLVTALVVVCGISLPTAFFPATWYSWAAPPSWLGKLIENGTADPLTYVYWSLWIVLLGIIIGIGLNRILLCVRIIDDYGRKFITSKRIDVHQAIIPGELTSVAKLVIKIDVILAMPITLSAWMFFDSVFTLGLVNMRRDVIAYMIGSIALFVFFSIFPLRHLHREMMIAKKRLIKTLDNELLQVNRKTTEGIERISLFHNIIDVRNKVEKMSTWGINTGLLIRFFVTGLLPLVIGALLQIWFQLLIPL